MINFEYRGKKFYFEKTATAEQLVNEIFNDNYKVFEREVEIGDGDVILDLGANEGMFSILMAKLFPTARIIAYEPVQRTFFQMIRNIGLNGVINIEVVNEGVGKGDGWMNVSNVHSGGSSCVDTLNPQTCHRVQAILTSIDGIFEKFGLDRVKLLKIDIEGSEHEALYDCKNLSRVDNMVAEFHINNNLIGKGYDMKELATWVGSQTNLVYYESCRMND